MDVTEERISEDQRELRNGRGYVDQIFTVTMLIEKYLVQGRDLFSAFMDLKKT